MKYKLIAMDLDGTLLNDKKEISLRTKETLLKCKEKGYLIVGVTARTLCSTENVAPLNLFDYLILNNGAYIYDVLNKIGNYVGKVDRKCAIEITKYVEKFSEQIDFVSGTIYYIYKKKKNSNLSFIKDIDSIEEMQEDIARMNIFLLNQDDVNSINEQINCQYEDVNCFITQDSTKKEKWLVVNPKGLDKRVTLEQLGKKLNIKLEEMIFFADGLNDLPVMESVGCSVAMGNALDIIKEKANEITLSNNEDGIAISLEKKIKLN